MSTWEERMAARAHAEGRTLRQEWEREQQEKTDGHAGHHRHLKGTTVQCSCGEDLGVTTVALPDLDPDGYRAWIDSLSCRVCGQRGVAGPIGE